MNIAYLGLGSNLQDPLLQLQQALLKLSLIPELRIIQTSSFYRTKPYGVAHQPDFINAVAQIETALVPHALLKTLLEIEKELGRVREQKWGPRIIDLDILLYEDQIINTPELTLPHPGLHQRSFVLYPLAEITPNLILPDGTSIQQFLKNASDKELVKIY